MRISDMTDNNAPVKSPYFTELVTVGYVYKVINNDGYEVVFADKKDAEEYQKQAELTKFSATDYNYVDDIPVVRLRRQQ